VRALPLTLVLTACTSDDVPRRALILPDLVLVVIDTLRADHLGAYGYDRDTSPHIDALATQGAWYHRAYAHSGWTLPSMASLLTATLPHQHRAVRDAQNHTRFGRLPDALPTLAERLGAAGYATGAVVNNTYLAPEFGLQRGFDRYDYAGSANDRHRSAAQTVRTGLSWLSEQHDPAFLLLHMMEPHLDYAPPGDLVARFTPPGEPPVPVPYGSDWSWARWQNGAPPPPAEEAAWITGLYDAEIAGVDRQIGALAQGLAARARPSVLVITSDHGEEFWDHGGFEHGHSLLGEVTRVPLVMAGLGPGAPSLPAGRVDAVVDHSDLHHALLALAAAAPGAPGADPFTLPADGTAAGVAISEDCLYGSPRASAIGARHRVVYDLKRQRVRVWPVDARGVEGEPLPPHALEGAALVDALRAARGDLRPITGVEGVDIPPLSGVWEQLESLGYLSEQ